MPESRAAVVLNIATGLVVSIGVLVIAGAMGILYADNTNLRETVSELYDVVENDQDIIRERNEEISRLLQRHREVWRACQIAPDCDLPPVDGPLIP